MKRDTGLMNHTITATATRTAPLIKTMAGQATVVLGKRNGRELSRLDAVAAPRVPARPDSGGVMAGWAHEGSRPTVVAGYEIPIGTHLMPCIHLAHRRAESWPEPDRFRPERFLGLKVDPYTWFPFGGGVRRCLGMAFALYEMKVVLGVTLLRAQLSLATREPLRVGRRGVTLAPAAGTPVTLEARRPLKIAADPLPAAASASA